MTSEIASETPDTQVTAVPSDGDEGVYHRERTSQRFTGRQTLAAVVVAAAIGGVGGASIYAATAESPHMMGGPHGFSGGPMHAPPPQPGGIPAPGAPGGQPPAAPPVDATPSGALHSEYVVSDGNGGFITKLTQTGVVDEVTLTNVVVRSDDGYTQIYAFPPGANRSMQPNDAVTVDATRSGATVTLNSIGDAPPPTK